MFTLKKSDRDTSSSKLSEVTSSEATPPPEPQGPHFCWDVY